MLGQNSSLYHLINLSNLAVLTCCPKKKAVLTFTSIVPRNLNNINIFWSRRKCCSGLCEDSKSSMQPLLRVQIPHLAASMLRRRWCIIRLLKLFFCFRLSLIPCLNISRAFVLAYLLWWFVNFTSMRGD